jgi:hypothetical protein
VSPSPRRGDWPVYWPDNTHYSDIQAYAVGALQSVSLRVEPGASAGGGEEAEGGDKDIVDCLHLDSLIVTSGTTTSAFP